MKPHIRYRQGRWEVFRFYVAPANILYPQTVSKNFREAWAKFVAYEYGQ